MESEYLTLQLNLRTREERREKAAKQESTGLDEKSRTKLSKKLSYALRHGAVELGLEISRDGYVAVNQLLQLKMFKPATFDQVKAAVEICPKQRFSLQKVDGVWKIRANQGHSVGQVVKDEDLLQRITSEAGFSTVVHGTYYRCWDAIRTEGLKVMTRNHIHFASGLPSDNGVMSGMRRSAEIWIFLDLKRALKDGIEFFLSSNGVILTPGDQRGVLSPLYFSRVVDSRTQRGIQAGLNTSNTTENRGAARRNHHDDDHYSKEYDYYAFLDFEATCEQNADIDPQEIIEFPTVLVDCKTYEIVSEFHSYVRPTANPRLSAFCTELTGIQQEQVDQAPLFPEVLKMHQDWMEANHILPHQEKSCLFITDSDADLGAMLPGQCALLGLPAPRYFGTWLDLKAAYREWALAGARAEGRRPGKFGTRLPDMLAGLGLCPDGRAHSGIDDARNLARVGVALARGRAAAAAPPLGAGPLHTLARHGQRARARNRQRRERRRQPPGQEWQRRAGPNGGVRWRRVQHLLPPPPPPPPESVNKNSNWPSLAEATAPAEDLVAEAEAEVLRCQEVDNEPVAPGPCLGEEEDEGRGKETGALDPPAVDFYAVLDFEATCEEGIKIKPQEIIEFPTVLVDARTLKVVSEFQTYVRPVHHPNLSGFCISLTGIQQEWVDQAPIFIEAFELHRQWMEVQGLLPYQGKNTILFVTCGDWDLMQMLPSQCRLTNTKIPSYLQEWVNIKDIFCQRWNLDKSMGMVGMLRKSGLRLEGRHHSGIDDCRNIARLLIQLCKDGCYVASTSRRRESKT